MNTRAAQFEEQPIIQVVDFVAEHGGSVVLSHVSLEIARGEVFVIAGGSGCGKTTLLKHMIGLYKPAGGRVLVDGCDIGHASGGELNNLQRRIGVAYQGGALFGSLSVLENVRLPLEEHTDLPPEAIDMIAISKLKLVGLESAVHKLPAELSGGMTKRAALARAIALDPKIVFLDEPSAGLDPITSAELDSLILRLNRLLRTTFVIVSHELPSIFAIADRAAILDAAQKTLVALGPPDQLRDHSASDWVRAFLSRRPPGTTRSSIPQRESANVQAIGGRP